MAKRRPWDKERIEKFIYMYPSSKWEVLEKEFACSRATLAHKACELGIQRRNVNSSLYSDNEDQILYKYHLTHTAKEISEAFLPHRTPASVEARMIKLGIGLRRRIQWNQENVEQLQGLYPIYPPAQVAEIMGTTYDAVISAARKFHIKSSINRKYSEQELSFIQDACKTMDDKEIGKILMRSAGSIKETRRTHGWKRPVNNNTKYNDLYHYLRKSNVCWKKKS